MVVPYYYLHNKTDNSFLELHTKEVVDYFDLEYESEVDDSEYYEQHNNYLSNIRTGKYKDLYLKIEYQYPSEKNGWNEVVLTD